MSKKKCNYYRISELFQYETECTGEECSVHPLDIKGDFCQFCGKKIKFNEFTELPAEFSKFKDY